MQKSCTPLFNRLVSNLPPTAINDFKPSPITRPQHCIHKFVLNLLCSQVNELPVEKVRHQQIVEKLRPMAIRERLDSLEFEGRAAVDESIEKIEFAKAFEPHLDRNFQLCHRTSPAQLPLINFLVEESPEILVNFEDVAHHVVRDSPEIVLI